MMKNNPYTSQPPRAFWRSAISDVSPLELQDVYRPRFDISKTTRIAAAGSCFAQHIGTQFKRRGFDFIDLEPAPKKFPRNRLHEYGFDLYSARYGNVYSVRQLKQLFERASGAFVPMEQVWREGDRFFDPFRPSIQPNGFDSADELAEDRAYHLSTVDRLLAQTDLFVFTFGLTEAWINRSDDATLPVCPGTIAGTFSDDTYKFHNFGFAEVLADAEAFIKHARRVNRNINFLFTVSPVPLTATATDNHVLVATLYSKSVLRAVCGELTSKYEFVDYFPSYELVASHPMRAMFYEQNLRSASAKGVASVMDVFFEALGEDKPKPEKKAEKKRRERAKSVVCDEELLDEFGE